MLALKPSRKAFIRTSYRERRCLETEPISELFRLPSAATHKSHSPEPTKAQTAYQLKAIVTPIPPSVGTIGKMISELGFSLSRCRWNSSSVVPTPTRAEPRISEAQ